MTLRPVRVGLHLAAATLLALGGVLLTGAPGQAADPVRPDSYGGDSTASAIAYLADRNPQPTPVTDAFHAEAPYAISSIDSSGGASATAASLYPGAGPLGVPALLCQFNAQVCQVIRTVPRYPFLASADYPTRVDDTADAPPAGSSIKQSPLEVTPGTTTAHADQDRVEATTRSGIAGLEGVLSVGSATSHSKQTFEGSTLVVTAESAVDGLDVGGGQVHIDQVRSVAIGRVDGDKVTSASVTTTLTGATAGGTPITVDSTGVHIAGNGDGGAATAAANVALKALDASGISMRLLTPSRSAKTGAVSAATRGLLIQFAHTVGLPGLPPPPNPIPGPPSPNGDYVGSATIAGAGVTAFATPATPIDLSIDTGSLGGPVAQPGTPLQPGTTAPLTGGAPAPAVGAAPAPGTAPVAAPAPNTREAAVLGVDLSSKRLKVLALVLLGYPLLVLLSAPLRAPARLPRVL